MAVTFGITNGTITGGTITASVTAENARALDILDNALQALGYPTSGMTPQQIANNYIAEMVRHTVQLARDNKVKPAVAAARAAVETDPENEWTE